MNLKQQHVVLVVAGASVAEEPYKKLAGSSIIHLVSHVETVFEILLAIQKVSQSMVLADKTFTKQRDGCVVRTRDATGRLGSNGRLHPVTDTRTSFASVLNLNHKFPMRPTHAC